jgi:hypothetical protein
MYIIDKMSAFVKHKIKNNRIFTKKHSLDIGLALSSYHVVIYKWSIYK